MFHTFRGSPGSSFGNRLRVRLATGSSNSPPTATSPIYHKPTERTKGENTKHWYTQEDPNPGKEHQEHNKQGMMFESSTHTTAQGNHQSASQPQG
jgi:hypothetical protein